MGNKQKFQNPLMKLKRLKFWNPVKARAPVTFGQAATPKAGAVDERLLEFLSKNKIQRGVGSTNTPMVLLPHIDSGEGDNTSTDAENAELNPLQGQMDIIRYQSQDEKARYIGRLDG